MGFTALIIRTMSVLLFDSLNIPSVPPNPRFDTPLLLAAHLYRFWRNESRARNQPHLTLTSLYTFLNGHLFVRITCFVPTQALVSVFVFLCLFFCVCFSVFVFLCLFF
eukprot:TRINITY_DN11176_c0_g4_i1.p1 TRINITY_DN11176_c0_g4~~TRINITY_DN11176_c0_g4_i1.p1  ORF type:complete len:108 (-),score=4.84 TRINITY_DN11176_c0_g4_i1:143-466(-)